MSNLPNEPTMVASDKRASLEQQGMREIGTILVDPETGERATVDYFGRVQWWHNDGSGRMAVAKETTDHYDRVRRFMRLADQATPDAPTEMDADTRELRARLLLEEAIETIERGLGISLYVVCPCCDKNILIDTRRKLWMSSMGAYDPVELLDGCCDVNVITTGTLIAAGLTDAEPQRLVDENNLAKFGPGSYRREDGKWIKPPNHQPPDLAGEIERQSAIEFENVGGA